jgi:hypothetical protein
MATTRTASRIDPAAAAGAAGEPQNLYVCAECRHAQVFTVQPRARCLCKESFSYGRTLFAGQPACASMAPRGPRDTTLASCLGGKQRRCAIGAASRVN